MCLFWFRTACKSQLASYGHNHHFVGALRNFAHHVPMLQCLKSQSSITEDNEQFRSYNVLKDEALSLSNISTNALKKANVFTTQQASLSVQCWSQHWDAQVGCCNYIVWLLFHQYYLLSFYSKNFLPLYINKILYIYSFKTSLYKIICIPIIKRCFCPVN